MKPLLKVALIVGGYILAFLAATAAVALHAALASESGNQASGGMSAFGDLVLFVAVFGAVALVPTGAVFILLFSKGKKPNRPPGSTLASGAPPAGHGVRHR
jgi:hypothetical protein